jgi:hypothetical protein
MILELHNTLSKLYLGRMHMLQLIVLFNIEHPDNGRMTTETCKCEQMREKRYTTDAFGDLFFNNMDPAI